MSATSKKPSLITGDKVRILYATGYLIIFLVLYYLVAVSFYGKCMIVATILQKQSHEHTSLLKWSFCKIRG